MANDSFRQRLDSVGRWRGQLSAPPPTSALAMLQLSSGGRFQWRWQARPRRGQLRLRPTCRSCWAMARAVSAPPPTSALAVFHRSVAVGDFNGDGKQDLATANFGSNNVSILLGNGDGQFWRRHQLRRWQYSISQSRWAISMAMASTTWPWQITVQPTCRSCWAMAGAVSAPPTNFGAGSSPKRCSGGRFQWRWQTGPGHGEL